MPARPRTFLFLLFLLVLAVRLSFTMSLIVIRIVIIALIAIYLARRVPWFTTFWCLRLWRVRIVGYAQSDCWYAQAIDLITCFWISKDLDSVLFEGGEWSDSNASWDWRERRKAHGRWVWG